MISSLIKIKKLISSARTEEAIEQLLILTENTLWHDEVIQQSAQFRDWQRSKRQGTLSTPESNFAPNRINSALLEIIGDLSSSELALNPSQKIKATDNFSKTSIYNNQLVEIILEGDLQDFNPTRRENLIHTISAILRIEASSIKIRKVVAGSIKVIIELPDEKGKELIVIFQQNPKLILDAYPDFVIKEINRTAYQYKENEEAKKNYRSKIWQYIAALGLIMGILGGLAEVLGFFDSRTDRRTTDNANTITVLAHGPDGKDDIVLPNRGLVYLIYGDAKISEEINRKGVATFKQISEIFFQEGASIELLFDDPLGEPYRARYPDSSYQLEAGQYISLEIVLEGMDQLEGTVKDFVSGLPVDSALVRIRGNSYYTNEFGEFTIDIPQERQEQFIDISISKPGYELKELTKVPTTTNQPQKISLKPIK